MKDVFKEQLVKRHPGPATFFAKAGIITAAFLLMLFTLMLEFIAMFVPVVWLGIGFGVFMALRRLSVEYEYALTNSELDIDIIYSKSRRRRRFSGNVRDIEAFRPVGSPEMEHSFSTAVLKLDFSSGRGEGAYEFLTSQGGKKTRIVIEPNEEILTAILSFLKRGSYPAHLRRN